MFTRSPTARIITSMILCLLAGYTDLYFFLPSLTGWYGSLHKPALIPSVTIIYYGIIAISILMGCAMIIIWNASLTNKDARLALWLVIFGLILNISWFCVFFWVKAVFFSLIVMAVLLLVIAAIIYQSLRSAVLAVLFVIPYFVVMLLAMYANVMIYMMNPNLPLLGIII